MQRIQQISRRTWLAQFAVGSFALWNELNFGLGSRGWSVAICDSALALGVADAQDLEPAKALQVNLDFVNAYVLIRGKEAAVVDTSTAGNASKIDVVVVTGGLSWDAVHHVILTHTPLHHIVRVREVLAAAANPTAHAVAAV